MQRVDIPTDIVDSVNTVLDTVRLETTSESEVEVRLYGPSGSKGVPKTFYETLLEFLRTKTDWDSITDVESIDFFYDNTRRTTKTFASDGSYRLTHEEKTRVGEVHLSVSGHPEVSRIRISHNRETEVEPKLFVTPTLVRRKTRSSFLFHGWSYDLTKVWEGAQYSVVQQRFCEGKGPSSYEVEIERKTDVAPYSATYLACSLLLKVQSVLKPSQVAFAAAR